MSAATDRQKITEEFEEKLREINAAIVRLERQKAYWERAIAYEKLEEERAA